MERTPTPTPTIIIPDAALECRGDILARFLDMRIASGPEYAERFAGRMALHAVRRALYGGSDEAWTEAESWGALSGQGE